MEVLVPVKQKSRNLAQVVFLASLMFIVNVLFLCTILCISRVLDVAQTLPTPVPGCITGSTSSWPPAPG